MYHLLIKALIIFIQYDANSDLFIDYIIYLFGIKHTIDKKSRGDTLGFIIEKEKTIDKRSE